MTRSTRVFGNRPKVFFGKRKRKLSENGSESEPDQSRPRPGIYTPESAPNTSKTASSSQRKVGPNLNTYDSFTEEQSQCYDIVNIDNLEQLLKQIAVCAKCGQSLVMNTSNRLGLSVKVTIKCTGCDFEVSEQNDKRKSNEQSELNTRLVYGFRCVGKGEETAKVVCGIMNLPNPPAFKYYTRRLSKAVKEVCVEGFTQAVEEAVVNNNSDRDSLCIALDGTWQRRGHRSLNGVVSAVNVDTGKVLNVKIFSKHCRCEKRLQREHDEKSIPNFEWVSGAMEIQGVSEIFMESQDNYGVKYKYYLGDGDSAAFPTVEELKPYGPEYKIEKLECRDIQKRMGSRLKKLKAKMGRTKQTDNKTIGGRGRLTDSAIMDTQKYYGLAIRRNTTSLQDMKSAVWAVIFHICSTDDSPMHNFCPVGIDSWCKYQRAKASNEHCDHFHLPSVVMEQIKPVFRDLASPDLLKKCLHGGTQNPNESLNNIIWSRISKSTFVLKSTLELGVYEAVSSFNQGNIVRCLTLKQLGHRPGNNLVALMKKKDELRIQKAEKAIKELEKKCRQKTKLAKLRLEELFEDEENPDNPSYAAGHY